MNATSLISLPVWLNAQPRLCKANKVKRKKCRFEMGSSLEGINFIDLLHLGLNQLWH